MYEEIKALKEYCDKIGVIATLEYFPQYYNCNWNFGYVLLFKNGSDCVQHKLSYGNENGKVEFGYTETRIDYKATTLKNAKAFVKRNKDKLNKEDLKNEKI